MSDKHAEEVELARRLFDALNCKDFTLTTNDKSDVIVEIDGCGIGVKLPIIVGSENWELEFST